MNVPHDPFAQSFDSIELDPTRAPSRDAIERAMAYLAPADDLIVSAAAPELATPGFYLIDDCGGRFVIDRDMGVVSLADESVLARDRGAVFPVRLRVIEHSGASYDMDLRLRLTGRVPQVLGAEDLLAAFGGVQHDDVPAPVAPPSPAVSWATHAVTAGPGSVSAVNEAAPFGAVIDSPTPPTAPGPYRLHLFTPLPQPAPKTAIWSL